MTSVTTGPPVFSVDSDYRQTALPYHGVLIGREGVVGSCGGMDSGDHLYLLGVMVLRVGGLLVKLLHITVERKGRKMREGRGKVKEEETEVGEGGGEEKEEGRGRW